MARLIGTTTPDERPESPQAALVRTHAERRRRLARRLKDAASVPALAEHLKRLLTAIPAPQSRIGRKGAARHPTLSSFHALPDTNRA